MCDCLGQVHFGMKSGGFQAMHNGNVSILDTRGQNRNGIIHCGAAAFGVNSTGGHECYCVRESAPDPLPKAEHCANDKGLSFCSCYGTVYYGRQKDKDNKTLSFAEMMKHGWTSALSSGDMLCGETSFDGDPAYGYDKQCFCETDPSYEVAPPAELCAEKERDECQCTGTVYYGRKTCPYDDVPLDFNEMMDYGYVSR